MKVNKYREHYCVKVLSNHIRLFSMGTDQDDSKRPTMPTTNRIFTKINTGDSRLEGLLEIPLTNGIPPCVVICHPNPRAGGNMFNNVVEGVSRSLNSNGIATLRFNFRGVGSSTGEFADGSSQVSDAIHVLEYTSSLNTVDGSRIGVVGYSFGAGIALESTIESDIVKAVVSIACPQKHFSTFGTVEIVQPKLLICGDRDHDFPASQFNFLSARFTKPCQSEILTGADHFFRGHEPVLGDLASDFFLGIL